MRVAEIRPSVVWQGWSNLFANGECVLLNRADLLALADDLAAILDTDGGYVPKHARVAG